MTQRCPPGPVVEWATQLRTNSLRQGHPCRLDLCGLLERRGDLSKVLSAFSLLSLGRRWIQHWQWHGRARGQSDHLLQLLCPRWFTITEGGLQAGHVTHTDERTAALFYYQSAMGIRDREGGEQGRAARVGIINIIQTTISIPSSPLSPTQRGGNGWVGDNCSWWPYCKQ